MGEDERKLYVGSIPGDVAEDEVREVFSLYGNIAEVHINFPKDGSRNIRSAFVRFEESQDAAAAMAVLSDMYKFRELSPPIRVNVARPAWGPPGGKAVGGKGTNGVAHADGGNSYGGYDATAAAAAAHIAGAGATGAPAPMPPPVATPPPPAATVARAAGGNPLTTPPPPAPSSGWGSGGATQNGGGSQWDGYGRAQANGRQWAPYAGDTGGARDPISGRDLGAKLWVGNLPGDSTPQMIEDLFKTYGKVEEVSILPNKSRSGQVCAFVHYATPAQADACIQVMGSGYELRQGEGELKVERPSTRGKGCYGGGDKGNWDKGKGKGKHSYQPY